MKYLHLKFDGARVIRTHRNTKDVFVDYRIDNKENRRKRSLIDDPNISAPMNVSHVSNMLHVLLGERPVPSRRESKMVVDQSIYELANSSLIRIDNNLKYVKSRGTYEPITEKIKTQKSLWNSYNANISPNWEYIRINLEDRAPILFEYLESISKGCTSVPLEDAIEIIKTVITEEQLKFLDTNFKIMYYSLTNSIAEFSKSKKKITLSSGIDNMEVYNGELIIPITSEQLERIQNGSGSATLLDGGLVSIVGVKEEHQIDIDFIGMFKLLSEL